MKKFVVVATSAFLTASSAFAADAPATATALAQAVDLSDAKAAGLIVTGLLVAVGVTLWGARIVLKKFTPK